MVAELTDFMVTRLVRKTQTPASSASSTISWEGPGPGKDDARHLAPEHALDAGFAHSFRQFLEVGQLRGAEYLDALVGEVGVKPGNGQAGTVERRFANVAGEARRAVDQLKLEGFLVFAVNLDRVTKSTFFTLDLLNIGLLKGQTKLQGNQIYSRTAPMAHFFEKAPFRKGMPHFTC